MKAGICWAAWQCGLASGFARLHPSSSLPPSLRACRPVWQCYPTTPVPRLQKPRLQLLRECQPVRAFPLVGRTHCHTATLSLLAKFLSCFALLSFFLFFSHFLTLPLSWLFSLLATPSLCLHIALLSRFPQWPLSFLPLFFFILVDFHELRCHFLLFCHWPATAHTHTRGLSSSH